MKRKFISLLLAFFLSISISISAFASAGFNRSVFNGRDDIAVSYDDSKKVTRVYTQDWIDGKTSVDFKPRGLIITTPRIDTVEADNDSLDIFEFGFDYFGHNWANLNEISISINGTQYNFSECIISHTTEYENLVHESISFYLKNDSMPFMDYFVKHQSTEIKIRLIGKAQSFDFVLTDDMKSSILLLYDLFTKGNGTRKVNMDNIGVVDQTVIKANNVVQKYSISTNHTHEKSPQTSSDTVWIPTHGGKKYHRRSTCSGMEDPEKTTKEDALRRGFEPCQRCY